MRAGRLKTRITFFRPTTTPDDYGQPAAGLTELASRRCELKVITGREPNSASGPRAEVTHEIRLRGDATIATLTTGDIAETGDGQRYDIQAVLNPDQVGREYIIPCVWRSR